MKSYHGKEDGHLKTECRHFDELPAMLTAAELAGALGPGHFQSRGLYADTQQGLSHAPHWQTAHGAEGQTDGLDRP